MKKYFQGFFALLLAFTLCVSASAAAPAAYTVSVNGQVLDLSRLPLAPYEAGGSVMVPLREVAEALGYNVGWDAGTKTVTVDDEYIQKAALRDGTAAAVFEGRLEVIDLSREVENTAKTVIHSGHTYVPAAFFEEFLNDVTVEGGTVKIAPSMAYIMDAA